MTSVLDDEAEKQQRGDAPSHPGGSASDAAIDTHDDTHEDTHEVQTEAQQEPVVQEDFLDVVVTSVDAVDGGTSSAAAGGGSAGGVVASAISASSSLLLGSQEYMVELVVTKGSGSYCIRRPLSEFLTVLQASDPFSSAALAAIPDFPSRQSKNDALIAKWCGDMTAFLAGTNVPAH